MSELSKEEYEALLAPLSIELSEMARWVAETGQRLVVLFEGRDTAGKGTTIHTIARALNPRQCKAVALSAPTEREIGQWYFQRYVAHLPAKGEIVLFDRSWYNRAGVERVMGYCTEEEAEAFLEAAPAFEKHLVEHGILLFKYWLTCDQDEQEQRLAERLNNPLKRWKISPIDIAARTRYDEYTEARERMLKATHTDSCAVDDRRFQRPAAGPADTDPRPARPAARHQIAGRGHPLAAACRAKPSKDKFGVLEPLPNFPIPDEQPDLL